MCVICYYILIPYTSACVFTVAYSFWNFLIFIFSLVNLVLEYISPHFSYQYGRNVFFEVLYKRSLKYSVSPRDYLTKHQQQKV